MSRGLPSLDQYERTNTDDWHPDPSGGIQRKSTVGGAKTNLPLMHGSGNCAHCGVREQDCPWRARYNAIHEEFDHGDPRHEEALEALGLHPPRKRRGPAARRCTHLFTGWPSFERALDAGSVTGRTCALCGRPEVLPAEPPLPR